jgi:tol-pal system protein YbgF
MPKRLYMQTALCGIIIGLLSACVQPGEFRSFQGEVRRGQDLQNQELRELHQQITDLQNRLSGLETDQDAVRKQLADLTNDYTGLQQDVASVRGDVEREAYKRSGIEDIEKTQKELKEQMEALKRETPPPVAAAPPKQPEPKKEQPEDLYKTAMFHFEAGDYAKAQAGFQDLLKRYPDSQLADNAQYWIGECYFRQGDYKRAILEYEKVLSQYPDSTKRPSALLKQGMAFEKLGDKESARYLYTKVTQDYPDSDQAPMAAHRLQNLP